jgi:outer membrane protein assembly factor BamB
LAFSADEHVAWKVELPGIGSSTPAVWGDHIFVTCPIGEQDGLVCYSFAGKELWRKELGPQRKGKHRKGSGSNPSPVTDGTHVVVYFKSGTLACLNFAGEVEWQINLQEKYGEDTLWWDLGTSPVLAAGKVVMAVMQESDSFLVALNLDNGDVAWKQARDYPCPEESDQSYTTPFVIKQDRQEVVVSWGADHLTGHEAATGKLLWECGGFNPKESPQWRVIASASGDSQVAVVPYGRGEFLAGINLQQASGDITASHRLWEKSGMGTDVPTPIVHGEQILLLTDKGKVYCLDKMTGEELWTGKLPRGKGKYYASPVLAGKTLYCAREDGIIMACTLDDNGLQSTQENDLGEPLMATPVPVRGKLLVRGETHLFLLGD